MKNKSALFIEMEGVYVYVFFVSLIKLEKFGFDQNYGKLSQFAGFVLLACH
jgi:hypothetical protein